MSAEEDTRAALHALARRIAEAHQVAADLVSRFVPGGDERAVRLLDNLSDATADAERIAVGMGGLPPMEYKGYVGRAARYPGSDRYHGHVLNTRAALTFGATDAAALTKAFRDTIDGYFDRCAREGREPERPGPHEGNR